MSPDERDRLVGLIEASHAFPGPFFFSTILRNDPDVADTVRAAFAAHFECTIAETAWAAQPSAGGRYVSLRITLPCQTASQVAGMYERLHAIDGVVKVM